MRQSAVSEMIAEAQKLAQLGRVVDAAKLYDGILARDGPNFDALKGRAYIAIRMGRLHDAANFFEKAARKRPRDPEVAKNLSGLSLTLHRPDLALKHALTALNIDDRDMEALRLAGESQYRLDNPKEARSLFERAAKLAPSDDTIQVDIARCLDTSGEIDAAREIYRKLINKPKPLPAALDGYLRLQKSFEVSARTRINRTDDKQRPSASK